MSSTNRPFAAKVHVSIDFRPCLLDFECHFSYIVAEYFVFLVAQEFIKNENQFSFG